MLNYNTKVSIIALAVLVFLTNISFADVDKQMIDKVKSAVKAKFKDPDSAIFRNVRTKVDKNDEVIGEVNAKNSRGAYIGYEKFHVLFKNNEISYVELESEAKKEIQNLISLSKDKYRLNNHGLRFLDSLNIEMKKTLYQHCFVDGWE